ncbi:FAD-dependent oxidoreductase, partial [Streptomyces sp. SID6013]|nr:FAD-dependent oxidoreductase [Streptomyces sp. SID6013]
MSTSMETNIEAVLDTATSVPLWLDTDQRPAPRPSLSGGERTELVVVGGGFTGLWTALRAKERRPDRDVLLLEGGRLGNAASGRNGGFCEASLTHGEHNGRQRWPDEFDTLERMGRENLAGLVETIERYGIDCGLEKTGTLNVATQPHQVEDFAPGSPGFLSQDDVRALVDSPTYLAGRTTTGNDCVLVDP